MPEVLARCACSLLPYDANDETIKCITINNRGFEILSFGLPLLYTDLPGLIKAPDRVIYRCVDVDDFQSAYRDAAKNFDALQSDIEEFLDCHYPDKRYEQLMTIVDSLR